jgi:deoxyribodipyrimidine photolyase-related protein
MLICRLPSNPTIQPTNQPILGWILADQLFAENELIQIHNHVLMVESVTEANKANYHKYKLVFIFTIIREFADMIKTKTNPHYYTLDQKMEFNRAILKHREAGRFASVQFYEPANKYFRTWLTQFLQQNQIPFQILPNPMFLTSRDQAQDFLDHQGGQLRMQQFYLWQRKRLGILVDRDRAKK